MRPRTTARQENIMADHPEDDDAALRARLDKLSASLPADTRPASSRPSNAAGDPGMSNAMGAGFRVVTELVAGVVVGGGIGWVLDRWLHTKPLLMILLGSLGLIGGFWNTVRAAMLPPGDKRFGKE
jgi:ATP synthase protein I